MKMIAMKKVVPVILMGLLLAAGQAQAAKGGKGGGGGGGGDKGGFGELGSGCLTFISGNDYGRISDDGDGYGTYCNGTGGQVSVPVRLRFDTKKLNSDKREFRIWGDCADPSSYLCGTTGTGVKGLYLQMGKEADLTTGVSGDDGLDWTSMSEGDTTRVEMGIKIDRNHFLYFNKNGVCWDPDNGTKSGFTDPVWVHCDGDHQGDGKCDQWTVSTELGFATGDRPGDIFTENAANACLKSGAFGDFIDYSVIADFTWKVCVMGLSCP
jgi:hypothetical protein